MSWQELLARAVEHLAQFIPRELAEERMRNVLQTVVLEPGDAEPAVRGALVNSWAMGGHAVPPGAVEQLVKLVTDAMPLGVS